MDVEINRDPQHENEMEVDHPPETKTGAASDLRILEGLKQSLENPTLFPGPFTFDCKRIDCSTLFHGKNINDKGVADKVLALTCLDPLHLEQEDANDFLPKTTFVRSGI